MATSVTKCRIAQKKLRSNKIQCTYKEKIPELTTERFPTFTKDLYVKVWPAPIPDRRHGDDRPVDYHEFLTPLDSLGSGRMGRTSVMVRKDFTKYACNAAPKADPSLMVCVTRIDAQVTEYVDAVRAVEPFMLLHHSISPFLMKILLTFRTRLPDLHEYYFFVNAYWANGCSLCKHLQAKVNLTESETRFYIMEIADALMSVHEHGLIFRRLCLCHILLEPRGHVRVSPHGLCEQALDCGQPCNMLVSKCGDQFYASPEVVFGVDVTAAADWWSLGVIMYQLLTGTVPFTGRTLGDLGKSITEHPVNCPPAMSGEAKCLIKHLLHKDPRRRLGFGPDGGYEFMKHPFFSCVAWADVRVLMDPPFKPKLEAQAGSQRPRLVKNQEADKAAATNPAPARGCCAKEHMVYQ